MAAPLDNRGKCQFFGIRFGPEGLDDKFRAIADELEVAYYQFWRQGLSKPFLGFDVRANPAQSKTQFDLLHGLIWNLHLMVFHQLNLERPVAERAPVDKYDTTFNDLGQPIGSRVQDVRAVINAPQRTTEANALKTRIQTDFGRTFTF